MGRGQKPAHLLTAERLFAQGWPRESARELLNAAYPGVASTELAKALRKGGFGNKYYRGGRAAAFLPTRSTAGGDNLDAAVAVADAQRLRRHELSSSGSSSSESVTSDIENVAVGAAAAATCSAEEPPTPQHTLPLPRSL